tara:strand:+ start:1464 stop:1691 length:228 start_codon:yes stop_codon:yes gene_type:complete
MSEENNNKTMNPAAFEAFIRELASQLQKFEVSNRQTVDFFNEAIRTVKTTFPNTEDLTEMEPPEEDDRPWVNQED